MPEYILGNRYRILGKIGEGGIATVYRAQDMLLERLVAVKVLREQYAEDPAFLERFKQEARSAAGLTHQSIVSVYDVGTDDGKHYIVMEYIDGTDLKQLINQGAPFTNARAISLSLQILSALAFAHSRGIIHRDIKPQNILVTPDGHAKVTDFGIARAATSAQLTDTGQVLGTVHYCSPEQAQGRPVTAASDLYSVGVIMYEMLTCQLPFDGEGPLSIALKHLQEDPVEPTRLNPRIPRKLESIVLRAMAKDPEHRFASADDMRQALLRFQQVSDQSTVQFAPVTPQQKPSAGTMRGEYRTVPIRPTPMPRRGFDWLSVVLVVLIVAALIGWVPLGQRVYQAYFSPSASAGKATPLPTAAPGMVVVPKLIGMQYSDAERQLKDLGLKIDISAEEYNDTYEQLAVISHEPGPGSQVLPQSTVKVVVSKGSERTVVPDVLQKPLDQARDMLERAGLKPHVVEQPKADVPAGTVFEQEPRALQTVQRDTIVTITVAKAAPPTPTPAPRQATPTPKPASTPKTTITVPHLVGMEAEAAQQKLGALGLGTTYINWQTEDEVADKAFFNTIPVGHVLSQSIAPNTEVQPGTTVHIAARKD